MAGIGFGFASVRFGSVGRGHDDDDDDDDAWAPLPT